VSGAAQSGGIDFEGLLRQALSPVDPPERLSERLESTLETLTETAFDELDSWEISAMRDPRNWVRPVVAGAVATTAGAGLVVMRARARNRSRKRNQRPSDPLELIERTVRDLAEEARHLLDRD